MNIWGEVHFKAGGDCSRLLNRIIADKLRCKHLYKSYDTLEGCCSPFTWKIIDEYCRQYNINCEIRRSFGLYSVFSFLRGRKGLVVGFFLGLVFVIFLSGIYLQTDIDGCKRQLKDKILEYLAANEIHYGMNLSDIDLFNLEIELMKNVDGISWAGIYTTGATLNINVLESKQKPEYNQRRLPSNLVAARDGQIVSVDVYGGQLKVPVGSGVHKGQVIVSGVVDLDEETKAFRRSFGSVYALYTEEITFECKFVDTRKVVYEDFCERNFFTFFSLDIPLFLKYPDYKTYNVYESQKRLKILDLELPFAVTTAKIVPYDFETTVYSYEQAYDEVYRLKNNFEQNFLSDCEIVEENETLESDEECVRLSLCYKVIGDIALEKEILIK